MPTKLLTLTEDEIGEHFWVQAQVNPKLPQDKMVMSQIAQAMRAPGPDGKPMMADTDIVRYIMEYAYPDEIKRNVDMQWFESQSPDVQQIVSAAMLERWKAENKDTVKLAEKALNPDPDKDFERMKKDLTPESFKQLVETAAAAKHEEMMSGMAPDQFMQGALQQGAMMQQLQDQMGRLPATVQPPTGSPAPAPGTPPAVGGPPGGPNPGAMPSQVMMSGNEQGAAVNPMMQNAKRARRGKPANNPKRK